MQQIVREILMSQNIYNKTYSIRVERFQSISTMTSIVFNIKLPHGGNWISESKPSTVSVTWPQQVLESFRLIR